VFRAASGVKFSHREKQLGLDAKTRVLDPSAGNEISRYWKERERDKKKGQ
jgi:hypothetical protein